MISIYGDYGMTRDNQPKSETISTFSIATYSADTTFYIPVDNKSDTKPLEPRKEIEDE